MKLTKLKSDAIDAKILAEAHKEVWLEYEELAEATRAAVERLEDKKGIRGLARSLACIVILLLVFIGGCNMVNGAFKDGAWLLDKAAENTEVQEKE